MFNQIKADTLTKYYKSTPAVFNVSFTLEKGFIYGLLGPNGAGKSTLCSLLSTATVPDTGEISFFSRVFSRNNSRLNNSDLNEIRKNIGFLPQSSPLFPEMTISEYLLFMGSAKGLGGNELYKAVNRSLEATGIDKYQCKVISSLSSGTAHRAAISGAIIGDPELLILDEPSNSLDPQQNILLRNIILNRKNNSKITLVSSHNLYEIQNICDRVIILSQGQIVKTGDLESLADKNILQISITLAAPCEALTLAVLKLNGVIACKSQNNIISVTAEKGCNIAKISSAITSNGGIIVGFSTSAPSLEDTYLKLISQ